MLPTVTAQTYTLILDPPRCPRCSTQAIGPHHCPAKLAGSHHIDQDHDDVDQLRRQLFPTMPPSTLRADDPQPSRCPYDERNADAYRRCTRDRGHAGEHRMGNWTMNTPDHAEPADTPTVDTYDQDTYTEAITILRQREIDTCSEPGPGYRLAHAARLHLEQRMYQHLTGRDQ